MHPLNALKPMEVILAGMTTLVMFEQSKNATLSILETLLGIITSVRRVQHENAPLPMAVTLAGIAKLPVLFPGH